MKKYLAILFSFVLLSMLVVTTWASLQESVWIGGGKLLREPWGVATLFDTYFAFFTFYGWVAYKERSWPARLFWLVAIVFLGNLAMAAYMLLSLRQVSPEGGARELLLRPERAKL